MVGPLWPVGVAMVLTRIEAEEKGRSRIYFVRPEEVPRKVLWLRRLLIFSAGYAVVAVFTAFLDLSPIMDLTWEIEELFFADPAPGEEALRDVARVASTLSVLVFLSLAFLLVFIPVRYLILAGRVKGGNPETYRSIRFVARVQIGMEVGRLLILLMLTGDLESVKVEVLPALTIVVAPLILLLLRHRDIRAHFSWYRMLPEAAMPESASALPTMGGPGAPAIPPAGGPVDPAHQGWETVR